MCMEYAEERKKGRKEGFFACKKNKRRIPTSVYRMGLWENKQGYYWCRHTAEIVEYRVNTIASTSL